MDWFNKQVEDIITGYVGTVTAYAVYADGREMLLLESIDTTGRPIEWWVDVKRAEVVE